MTRDLDYRSLARPTNARDRLRAMAGDNLTVYSLTLGGILMLVPVVVTAVLLGKGGPVDGGIWAGMAMLFLGGLSVVVSMWFRVGSSAALERFAGVNGLTFVSSTMAPSYAGSLFADRAVMVDRSVRTAGPGFVEVGDRFPVHTASVREAVGRASYATDRTVRLFLRAGLRGETAPPADPAAALPPELHEALLAFAGPYEVEVAGGEVTVFGSEKLDNDDPARVAEAFRLADALAAQFSTAGAANSAVAEQSRRRHPLVIVLGLLGFLVVTPFLVAGVFSAAEAIAGAGSPVVLALVPVVLAAMLGVGGWGVRRLFSPPRPAEEPPAA